MKTNATTPIPQGYKSTPLGIIPQEWEVRRLGEISVSISSGKNKYRDREGQYPVYGSTGIIGFSSEFRYEGVSILVARVGANAGILNLVSGKYDVSDNTLVVIAKSNLYDYYFAYNQLVYCNLNRLVFGSGQPLITSNQLKNITIPVPPLAEQKKIAEVLGVWDRAIEKQSQLIEQLTLRKRGLMQQLLTAKRRLPGFSDPWKKVRLEEICLIKRGNPLSSTQIRDGIYPVIAGGKTSPYFHDEYTDENVITISASGAYAGFVSLHEDKIWASDCSVISSRDGLSVLKYIYYLLALKQIYIYSLQVGGAQPHVLPIDIAKMKIYVPAKAEQTAIAQVLTAADREIELAQQKLELLRQQKRGLMQQLLTGKKRVKL
ncbi:restriction endonuclease subunit S [Barnesiella viscericola]|uniref:restriction endonuclease subunit S n=1 Tax=Barnesiella viscericola TaxID=397865 RepID=UPI0025A3F5CD|nr:restriction endonuclease subunit S [Barnesiella viscericola]MDM8269167.1 restriction endonuclease subunit S [Barnesiella viscericola]